MQTKKIFSLANDIRVKWKEREKFKEQDDRIRNKEVKKRKQEEEQAYKKKIQGGFRSGKRPGRLPPTSKTGNKGQDEENMPLSTNLDDIPQAKEDSSKEEQYSVQENEISKSETSSRISIANLVDDEAKMLSMSFD